MNYKKNDTIYCIKDVYNEYKCQKVITHKKGHIYRFNSDLTTYQRGILGENKTEYIYICSEPNTTPEKQLGFVVNGYVWTDWHNFKEFFADIKHYRKEKLKKLQNATTTL